MIGDMDKLKLYINKKVRNTLVGGNLEEDDEQQKPESVRECFFLECERVSRAKGTCSKSEGRLKHLRSVVDSEEVLLFCCLSVGGFYITTVQIWFGLSLHFVRWCFGKKTVALHPFLVPRIISRALFFQLAFFKRMVRYAIFYPLPQNLYLFAFSYISKPLVERRWYWTTWCS